MKDALLIIPAFNEEGNIARVLESVLFRDRDYDVLVVNDGSGDSTREIVRGFDVVIVSHPFNLGYGAALQTGFKFALLKGYKFIIQFDADGQHNIRNVDAILEELIKGEFDIVVGSRLLGKGLGREGFLKRSAINFFRTLISLFSGVKVTDPTSGLKGLSRNLFGYYSKMGSFPADFPDADVLIRTIRCGFKLKELPAEMNERTVGTSMHSGLKPIYYVLKVLLSIFMVLLREKSYKEGSEKCEFNR